MNTSSNYALHYGQYHRTDGEYFRQWSLQNQAVIQQLAGGDLNISVLDVGCGFGLLVHCLMQIGYRDVKGIDIDSSQIEVAASHRLPCECIPEALQTAFFEKEAGRFSRIFLFDVLEHISTSHQVEFLAMIARSLRSGGQLLVQVPNASSPIASHMRYIDQTHTSAFTVDSLRFTLMSAGFSKITISSAPDETTAANSLLQPMRLFRKGSTHLLRGLWRLIYMGEFGRPGIKIPLGRNLLAIAEFVPE